MVEPEAVRAVMQKEAVRAATEKEREIGIKLIFLKKIYIKFGPNYIVAQCM